MWNRALFEALAVVVTLGALFGSAGEARAFHEDWQLGPGRVSETDGQMVIWAQGDDIVGVDLDDGEVVPLVVDAAADPEGLPGSVDIDHGIIVWEDQGSIKAKSLHTGDLFTVTSPDAGGVRPAISENWVVWQSGGAIMARDLSTMAEPIVLAERERVGRGPVIAGRRVIWEENPNRGQWQLFMIRIGETEPVLVAQGYSISPGSFGFDIARDILVYVTSLNQIAALDVETGETIVIEATPYSQHPTTDGRYVFWMNGDVEADFDLYGYDLASDSRFFVAADVSMPDAKDGVVTWTGEDIIYAAPIADVLPSARRSDPGATDPAWRYFPETGHYLAWGFKAFWQANGGLTVFGYPLTEEFSEKNPDTGAFYTVQYFERQRFEWHPENQGTPYEVLLGRLGAQLLAMQGRDWTTFPKADPSAPHYFLETDHAIAPEFWVYWSSHGLEFGDAGVSFRESLALFGYPLSEPTEETNADGDTVLTQYFERAVFEYHPDNPEPHTVLLRRVGAEVLAARGW